MSDDPKSQPLPPLDVARACRGRYLHRHHARVIEQDDLFVVEFVDQTPWYTRLADEAEQERRNAKAVSLALLSVGTTTSLLTLLHFMNWI